jgi:hypothetical protein
MAKRTAKPEYDADDDIQLEDVEYDDTEEIDDEDVEDFDEDTEDEEEDDYGEEDYEEIEEDTDDTEEIGEDDEDETVDTKEVTEVSSDKYLVKYSQRITRNIGGTEHVTIEAGIEMYSLDIDSGFDKARQVVEDQVAQDMAVIQKVIDSKGKSQSKGR